MALATLFGDIAGAIREKDGTTGAIVANTFPARIRGIPSGGAALTSISITTPPAKTSYVVDETFDPAGMVATAVFSNGDTIPVDETGLSYSPSGALSTAVTQVTVSLKFGAVVKTAPVGIDVIEALEWWSPHMTSNTSPSPFVCSASSELHPAYCAFDGNPDSMLHSSNAANSWIAIDFGGSMPVKGIRLIPMGWHNNNLYEKNIPKQFTVYGSNNATDWTALYTNDPSVETAPVAGENRDYVFDDLARFRHYKVQADTVNWDGEYYFCPAEIMFYKVAES